ARDRGVGRTAAGEADGDEQREEREEERDAVLGQRGASGAMYVERHGHVLLVRGGGDDEIGDGGIGERGPARGLDGGPAFVRGARTTWVAGCAAEEAAGLRAGLVEAV